MDNAEIKSINVDYQTWVDKNKHVSDLERTISDYQQAIKSNAIFIAVGYKRINLRNCGVYYALEPNISDAYYNKISNKVELQNELRLLIDEVIKNKQFVPASDFNVIEQRVNDWYKERGVNNEREFGEGMPIKTRDDVYEENITLKEEIFKLKNKIGKIPKFLKIIFKL